MRERWEHYEDVTPAPLVDQFSIQTADHNIFYITLGQLSASSTAPTEETETDPLLIRPIIRFAMGIDDVRALSWIFQQITAHADEMEQGNNDA
ncbi:hypothetical protein [Candidatus Palauibacter sp.]|uniref:hypothetical protein n=1 Tax=Candidatus Palauibacter sp. TaxID=3101350 RepID=UPI003B01ED7E